MQPVSHHFKLFGSVVNPDKPTRMRLAYHQLVTFYRTLPYKSNTKVEAKVWRKLNQLWNNDEYFPVKKGK